MTEEIEAHVLKKYEILQKLGMHFILPYLGYLALKSQTKINLMVIALFRQRRLRYCVESN